MNLDRETFGSRVGMVLSMMGVAVGLGNVWRFPYMVGEFGGAPFVLFYVGVVVLLGAPTLMAEWALGRHTRRGPVGAFERAGMPQGRRIGWFFFVVVVAATAYYTCTIGWVMFHGLGLMLAAVGLQLDAAAILPPSTGYDAGSVARQLGMNLFILVACALVVSRGVRAGIERASVILMPLLFAVLILLVVRSLTLDGAWAGVEWYALKFEPSALTPAVMVAAVGQGFYSLSLGGTFMVMYASYLGPDEPLGASAAWTAGGDTLVGLLAGLAIIPAVFALGLEPSSGPDLIFTTLPQVFSQIPGGSVFGVLFFVGLSGAAYLSNLANFEVMVTALMDERGLSRRSAAWTVAGLVFVVALVPMSNQEIFAAWDLTFGSGMQTLGATLAVVAVAWVMHRAKALKELTSGSRQTYLALYYWLRFVVPTAIVGLGVYWLLTDVLGVVGG